jgi:hypothetical protein
MCLTCYFVQERYSYSASPHYPRGNLSPPLKRGVRMLFERGYISDFLLVLICHSAVSLEIPPSRMPARPSIASHNYANGTWLVRKPAVYVKLTSKC